MNPLTISDLSVSSLRGALERMTEYNSTNFTWAYYEGDSVRELNATREEIQAELTSRGEKI